MELVAVAGLGVGVVCFVSLVLIVWSGLDCYGMV